MKKIFPGYYRPSDAEFDALWQSATFVLDASVLLNIYRYSMRSRTRILDLVESLRERVWVPHQFAQEFLRNRPQVIYGQAGHYREAARTLSSLLEQNLRPPHTHPFVPRASIQALENVCKQLRRRELDLMKLLSVDPYLERLTASLEGRIGARATGPEVAQIHKEAQVRYSQKIPPGYMDAKKPGPEAYGDFIGWRQILNYGSSENVAVILVIDDKKEDWWHIQGERQLGPRPELIEEYLTTSGKPFYMYTFINFLKYAEPRLGTPIGKTVLDEVRARVESSQGTKGEAKSTGQNKPDIGVPQIAGMKPLGIGEEKSAANAPKKADPAKELSLTDPALKPD